MGEAQERETLEKKLHIPSWKKPFTHLADVLGVRTPQQQKPQTLEEIAKHFPHKDKRGLGDLALAGAGMLGLGAITGLGGLAYGVAGTLIGGLTFYAAAKAVNYFGDGIGDALERAPIPPEWKGTLAAVGSSLPEFFVSTLAALGGTSLAMAIGNYTGSNLCNPVIIASAGLVLAHYAHSRGDADHTAYPIEFQTRHIRDAVVMLATSGYLATAVSDGDLTKLESVPLAIGGVVYTASLLLQKESLDDDVDKAHEERFEDAAALPHVPDGAPSVFEQGKPGAAVGYGLGGMLAAAKFAVNSLERCVDYISSYVSFFTKELAAKTVLAISTSIPEIAISNGRVKRIREELEQEEPDHDVYQRQTDMVIDTVMKSNIYNVFFCAGTALLASQPLIADPSQYNDYVSMLAIEGVLLFSALRGKLSTTSAITIAGTYVANMAYNVLT